MIFLPNDVADELVKKHIEIHRKKSEARAAEMRKNYVCTLNKNKK